MQLLSSACLVLVYTCVFAETTNLDIDDDASVSKRHASYSYRNAVCSSTSYRFRICNVPLSRGSSVYRMWVKKKYSRAPCRFHLTFGFAGRQIWVNHGCRAKFGLWIRNFPGKTNAVIRSCNSHGYRYAKCYLGRGTIKGMRVIDQRSRAPCKYRHSFGIYRGHSIWVNHGCRATFRISKSH